MVGADFSDPAGWLAAIEIIETGSGHQCRPGGVSAERAACVLSASARRRRVAVLLARTNQLLADYHKRLEMIESFVYMHCVGIQLEKHYSQMRSEALAMFEEKTNITTAINVAMKRNLPGLVEELQGKLNSFPSNISHTFVKQAKERRLISKNIREDLQKMAERRFQRAKETSTERVIAMIRMWADRESVVQLKSRSQVSELWFYIFFSAQTKLSPPYRQGSWYMCFSVVAVTYMYFCTFGRF